MVPVPHPQPQPHPCAKRASQEHPRTIGTGTRSVCTPVVHTMSHAASHTTYTQCHMQHRTLLAITHVCPFLLTPRSLPVVVYGDTGGGIGVWYHQQQSSRPQQLGVRVDAAVHCLATCSGCYSSGADHLVRFCACCMLVWDVVCLCGMLYACVGCIVLVWDVVCLYIVPVARDLCICVALHSTACMCCTASYCMHVLHYILMHAPPTV